MDDLVEYLLFRLKENNIPISKYKMQKFIFKIKMDLGKNHELYDDLPYYWYFHGPFSEVLNDSWNYILPKCNLNINSALLNDKYYNEFNVENNIISSYSEIEMKNNYKVILKKLVQLFKKFICITFINKRKFINALMNIGIHRADAFIIEEFFHLSYL